MYFDYKQQKESSVKKRKSLNHESIHRHNLDRRRFEEAFLLFTVAKQCVKYDLSLEICIINRNDLLKDFALIYYPAFLQKWSSHLCATPGCSNVIVIDGNMKNCRQVCGVKDVTVCLFQSIAGEIKTGCINTPQKGYLVCKNHIDSACLYKDEDPDSQICSSTSNSKDVTTPSKETDMLCIIKICNSRQTRSNLFYQVLWTDGTKTWLNKETIPQNVLDNLLKSENIVEYTTENVYGQKKRIKSVLPKLIPGTTAATNQLGKENENVGFAFTSDEDMTVTNEKGDRVKLKCGTEKSNHRAKNRKTAGILAFVKPCGVVVNVKEIFNSESKSQVYGHLHDILALPQFNNIDCICYDYACHLMKYAKNKIRKDLTKVSNRMAELQYVVDRFHFPNHVDRWCKKMCNPYKCRFIEKVNTEACEQLFSWLSNYSRMTKYMNRDRFLYFILYVLDSHNDVQVTSSSS